MAAQISIILELWCLGFPVKKAWHGTAGILTDMVQQCLGMSESPAPLCRGAYRWELGHSTWIQGTVWCENSGPSVHGWLSRMSCFALIKRKIPTDVRVWADALRLPATPSSQRRQSMSELAGHPSDKINKRKQKRTREWRTPSWLLWWAGLSWKRRASLTVGCNSKDGNGMKERGRAPCYLPGCSSLVFGRASWEEARLIITDPNRHSSIRMAEPICLKGGRPTRELASRRLGTRLKGHGPHDPPALRPWFLALVLDR